MTTEIRNIVIIGGGIIGCTTAYYLTRHPAFSSLQFTITILEASKHGVAQGASGKAGGLVARWAYPKEIVNVSFPEHIALAKEHNGSSKWGWRYVGVGRWEGQADATRTNIGSGVGKGGRRKSLEKKTGLPVSDGADRTSKGRKELGLPDDLDWVREDLTSIYEPMAGEGDTAQVHPRQFTRAMLELAEERGAKLILGRATEIERKDGAVVGVKYVSHDNGEVISMPAGMVVLAGGAWSPALVPTLPISGTRAHSITIKTAPGRTIAPYALFTEISMSGPSVQVTPEIYARPEEVYACGPGDDSKVPLTVDEVECDEAACESVRAQVTAISDELAEGEVTARQACFLPLVSVGGGPIIGEAPKVARRLYIATGHTCWGICNAPGTAKALAELILDQKVRCTSLKELDPARFML